MLSSLGIRAYRNLHRKFFSPDSYREAFNNSIFIIYNGLACPDRSIGRQRHSPAKRDETFGWALEVGGKCGLHNGWRWQKTFTPELNRYIETQ